MAPGRVACLMLLSFLWPQDIPPLLPWFCPALLSSETLEKGREKEGNGLEVGFGGGGPKASKEQKEVMQNSVATPPPPP